MTDVFKLFPARTRARENTIWYLDFHTNQSQALDNLAGIASRHTVGGNVVSDDTARPYHCAVAYGDSRTDCYVTPKPTVLSNLYGESRLNGLATLEIVDGMLGSVERAVGTDERMGSDSDVASVEKRTIIIYKYALAKMQAIAMVAMKGRKDCDRLGHIGDHRLEHGAIVVVVDARLVEFLACQA